MSLRIIPLGGLGEVGKNMTVYEHGDEIVVVDAGLAFPRDEHLGVDLVLPDIGYLRDRRVNAVVLTHGHEDHVGGLPYLLREVDCDQVIGTKLTLGLIKSKLDEHGLSASTRAAGGRDRASRSRSARSRSTSSASRTRSRTASRSCSRRTPGVSSTRATGSSTTRRSTA